MSDLKSKYVEPMRNQKVNILKYVATHGVDKISVYSATTFIPLLAIYTFILEDVPEHKELCEKTIAELEKFYGL